MRFFLDFLFYGDGELSINMENNHNALIDTCENKTIALDIETVRE